MFCSTSSYSNSTFDVLLAQGFIVIKITGTTILTLTGRGHGRFGLRRWREKGPTTGQLTSARRKKATKIQSDINNTDVQCWNIRMFSWIAEPVRTSITFGFTPWYIAGALWAGAGVASRPKQTQMAADSLTRILHYTWRKRSESWHTQFTYFLYEMFYQRETNVANNTKSSLWQLIGEKCAAYWPLSCISAAGTQRPGSARVQQSATWS